MQRLFATDTAIRANLSVRFDAGKKQRQGVLLRLGESRVRVQSMHQPQPYERLTLVVTETGRKDPLKIQVEVTRVRQPEGDGGTQIGDAAFDAKVTGSNTAATMARLRALIQSLEGGPAQARG